MKYFKFLNEEINCPQLIYENILSDLIETQRDIQTVGVDRQFAGCERIFADGETPKILRILDDYQTLNYIEFRYRITYFEGLTRVINDYVKVYHWEDFYEIMGWGQLEE